MTNRTVISESSPFYTFNGFVAYDSSVNRIVMSIAGTDPLKIKDWVDDLNFFKTEYPYCKMYNPAGYCEVHEGFLGTYEVAKSVVRSVISSYKSSFPTATLHLTGHSLGAILALLTAMDLKLTMGISVDSLLTFGQPRGGDDAFADFATATIPQTRVTHHTDPVPHLPPMRLALQPYFRHPAGEVFYPQFDSLGKHVICEGQEDSSCSDQYFLDLNLLEHLDYVGFDFIGNYMGCKF